MAILFSTRFTLEFIFSWELWGSNPRGNLPLGLKSNALTTRPNSPKNKLQCKESKE